MVHDVFSKIPVVLNKSSEISSGFYHSKHFVIMKGRIVNSKFVAEVVSQPVVDDTYRASLTSHNYDFFGYKSKYMHLLSNLSGIGKELT